MQTRASDLGKAYLDSLLIDRPSAGLSKALTPCDVHLLDLPLPEAGCAAHLHYAQPCLGDELTERFRRISIQQKVGGYVTDLLMPSPYLN